MFKEHIAIAHRAERLGDLPQPAPVAPDQFGIVDSRDHLERCAQPAGSHAHLVNILNIFILDHRILTRQQFIEEAPQRAPRRFGDWLTAKWRYISARRSIYGRQVGCHNLTRLGNTHRQRTD